MPATPIIRRIRARSSTTCTAAPGSGTAVTIASSDRSGYRARNISAFRRSFAFSSIGGDDKAGAPGAVRMNLRLRQRMQIAVQRRNLLVLELRQRLACPRPHRREVASAEPLAFAHQVGELLQRIGPGDPQVGSDEVGCGGATQVGPVAA